MNDASPENVLQVQGLQKYYYQGLAELHILRGVNLTVQRGERIAIVGLSGSGKSTLLHLLGGLDSAAAGSVLLNGVDLATASDSEVCRIRNRHLGFVYQFHHLMADFNAAENVAMPLMIGGLGRRQALTAATTMLARVGLANRSQHRPAQLSGGERQRVAMARALVTAPDCVLADEPTGNLDEQTAADVNELMVSLSHELRTSFIVVTHNIGLARRMDKVYRLHNGLLSQDMPA
ncbi:MAG: ATP-binding cassette domain-containing protein [Pseudomonadales bacterium]|jgi:lipoprotein-releasing system ATP-binding protein|nr:ATP-binding cassette domain-containing protein [Pseudomonadales bacterium]